MERRQKQGYIGPFVIKRSIIVGRANERLCYVYEVVNSTTGVVVKETTSFSPVPPEHVRKRQAYYNTRALLDMVLT